MKLLDKYDLIIRKKDGGTSGRIERHAYGSFYKTEHVDPVMMALEHEITDLKISLSKARQGNIDTYIIIEELREELDVLRREDCL
jgi:hypothetical protein